MQPHDANSIHRRWFLGITATGLASWGLARLAAPVLASKSKPRVFQISGPDETGEPMQIDGRVMAADGKTPAAGVIVYLYHTDSTGVYASRAGQSPRLRAWIRTDEHGRFAYRTIRPAPYPGRKWAAHVHTQLWGDDVPAQYGTTLRFRGDALLRDSEREQSRALGRFGFIRPLSKQNGVWRGTHLIRLKRTGDRFEQNIRHGLDDAPARFRP